MFKWSHSFATVRQKKYISVHNFAHNSIKQKYKFSHEFTTVCQKKYASNHHFAMLLKTQLHNYKTNKQASKQALY